MKQDQDRFFSEMFKLRSKISFIEEWMSDYRKLRESFPQWETRDHKKIKVENLTDSHLENLIKWINPGCGWDEAFAYEKKYRQFRFEIQKLERQLSEMEEIADTIF